MIPTAQSLDILLVMVSANPGVGGLEKHTTELANGLAQAGHKVTVMCAPCHQDNLCTRIQRIALNPKQSRYNPLLLARLYRHLSRGQYHVVHAQGTKAAALLAALAHLPMKAALVASLHGFKSRYPSLKRFNAVIAVSRALAKHLPTTNVRVVYNGLPPSLCHAPANPELAQATPKPVWLAVGRLVSVKGFAFLIDSFKSVEGCLFIAGDGPERADLQQKILDNRLEKKIILLGHREDVPALMAACDGVVISSRREGFSYVFAEALLAEKPVIATDVPIANEFLPAQHIYRSSTADGFANLLSSNLQALYADQASARARAQQELTLQAMIDNTCRVYYNCSA